MTKDNLTLQDFMPGTTAEGTSFKARAGEPLAPGEQKATQAEIIDGIKEVYDPEIPVNLFDLGLIYTIEMLNDGDVVVEMSLTAPGCPVAGEMPGMVADAVCAVKGVGRVEVELVWDPPWTKDRMSEEARLILDMF
ncbi:SUF system Fe-S cluster assembly protein [Alphaproteobacteria bacterium]|jgi:FeS assembly SUF system protein|nr:SUF system Fe-S cluster assembly protein [Alphaproteobacteria bacterium]